MDCLFCKIAKNKIPAKIVYEDDKALAFEDINPQAPVHMLIIPRKHISSNFDITRNDHELFGHMHQVANELAKQRGVANRGFRLVMNCNSDAGQTVFHIHLHMLAGRAMHWPPG
jgi:histidine triad (HIT) family protein